MAERSEAEAKAKKEDRTTNGRVLRVLGSAPSVARVLLVDIDETLVKGGQYNEALIAAIKEMQFDRIILFTQRGKYMQEENLRLDSDTIGIATLLEYLQKQGIDAEVSTSIDPFMQSDDAFPYWQEYKKDAAYEEKVKTYFAAEYKAKFDEDAKSREAKLAEILPQQSEIFKAIAGEVAMVVADEEEQKRLLELQRKSSALTRTEIASIEELAKAHCPKDKIAQFRDLTAKLMRDSKIPYEFLMVDDSIENLRDLREAMAKDLQMPRVGLIDALRGHRFKSTEEYMHDFQLAISLAGVDASILQRAQRHVATISAQIQEYREAKSKEGGVSRDKEALLADLWAAIFSGDPKKAAGLIEQSRLEGKSGIKKFAAMLGMGIEPTALFQRLDAVRDNIIELAEFVSRVRLLQSAIVEAQKVIIAASSPEALEEIAHASKKIVEALTNYREKINLEQLKILIEFSEFLTKYLHLYRAEAEQKGRSVSPDTVEPILRAIAEIGTVIAKASKYFPVITEEKKKEEKKSATVKDEEVSSVDSASSNALADNSHRGVSSTPQVVT